MVLSFGGFSRELTKKKLFEILLVMKMYKQMDATWLKKLKKEINAPYFARLMAFLEKRYELAAVYPAKERVFSAFALVPFDKVQVVILGQDPYHSKGVATGAAFAVEEGNKIPPSLRNIYKEIQQDLGSEPKNLWEMQKEGVFLLNTLLTVEEGAPLSHRGKGWESFTDAVLRALWEREEKIVFLLWGRNAKKKGEAIFTGEKGHLVLEAGHPSPLSARLFFGCKHFSKAAAFLRGEGKTIDWCKG